MTDTRKPDDAAPDRPDSQPDAKPVPRRADKPKPLRWKKWLPIAGAVALAVVAAVVMLQPKMVDVQLASAKQAPLSVSVEAQGRTRARLRYTVAAPISGRLLRTRLGVGDRVERGEVLARITPPPSDARSLATSRAELAAAQARQRQASAARAEAASGAERARAEAARRTELFGMGMVSAESRDSYAQAARAAGDRLASADAALVAAQAEVQSARSLLLGAGVGDAGAIEVRAPVSGQVLRVIEESERVLAAGSPLFDLSQGDALELVVDVLTQDAVQVRAGQPIRITGWGGPTVLAGKVRHVEPGAFTKVSALGVEEQRVNVIGDLDETPPTLGAGYRIEAAIVTWSGEQVLQLPTGALFRRDGAWQTFAVEAGRARLRKVELGHRNAEFAEVRAGIKAGEEVVVFPSDRVADGVRLRQAAAQPR